MLGEYTVRLTDAPDFPDHFVVVHKPNAAQLYFVCPDGEIRERSKARDRQFFKTRKEAELALVAAKLRGDAL